MSAPAPSVPAVAATTAADQHTLVAAFLQNVPDCVYFKDRASRFLAVSRSMCEKVGHSAEAMTGRTDFDFFAEDHARPAFEDEREIMRTGQPIVGKLEKETWPDGRVSWVLTSKMPLRDADGAIVGTFGISKDVTQAKETELALERAQRELLLASRQAGMAEVATGVLHNVGNVLNSVNVAASVVATGLRDPRVETLNRVGGLLREHDQAGDLADYLTRDPKGRLVPGLVASLASHFATERERLLREIAELQASVDHIKEIVSMQQAYASAVGVTEPLDPAALMEDAVRMNGAALARHCVTILREFEPVPSVLAERGKVLQVLVNLIRNAKHACDDGGASPKVIRLRLRQSAAGHVQLVVADNGVGIPPENLTRIFQHGFTTRPNGHGFGLHSSALAARELKGSLTAASDGPGRGATFVLELPAA
ncbi:MAG TPA: PAS domain-containing sensor histidine kinase [Opitutaceae bacterium]|nr:PAS domain-containing sensor histidine kinase [Opitutaceae bacterium]